MKPICITCKADCHNAGTTSRIVDCSQYKPGRILTNADRIRAMSDQELAEHIWKKFGAPQITKDGVTVAKEIELSDPYANIDKVFTSIS